MSLLWLVAGLAFGFGGVVVCCASWVWAAHVGLV